MGLFGKLFDKKECAICGGEIGLMGNRKLEDGNMCKDCAAKLSPWFSERKSSTIAQINEQLAYREENRKAVSQFHTTRSLGENTKLLLDEDARKFTVTAARDLEKANPDILDYSQVTGVDIDIDESKSEDKRKDREGKMVSYIPPRYFYSYRFAVVIHVNHPYFDEMRLSLTNGSFKINPSAAATEAKKPDPMENTQYREYDQMAKEIKRTLTGARQKARREIENAQKPKTAVNCPWCGASTIPDENGCCEYCGGALKG